MSAPRYFVTGELWRASIGGVVSDARSEEALVEATVELTPAAGGAPIQSLTTLSDGSFCFGNLPAADYTVTASFREHQPQSKPVTVTDHGFQIVLLALPPVEAGPARALEQ